MHDVVAEALAVRRGDLLPHLVAARPDRRADRGCESAAAERLDSRRDDSREQPLPAGVEDGDRRRSLACGRGRSAGSRRTSRGAARPARPSRARRRVLAAAARVGAEDTVGVHLVVEREPLDVGAERVAREAAVLVDALDVVAALAAEVERRVGPLAHAADARREPDDVAAGVASGSAELLRPREELVARVELAARRERRREAPGAQRRAPARA